MAYEEPEQEDKHIRKARKARTKLIIVIVVCFLIVAAIVAAVIYMTQQHRATSKVETAPIEVVDEDSSAAKATTTVPNLVALFGKTTDEALAALGSKASVSSTASGTTTIVIASDNGNTTTNPTSVYLGFNEEGRISEVLYSVSFDSLGNPTMSFKKVLADTDFLTKTLKTAGVETTAASFPVPEAAAYETRTTAANGTSTVTKEEYKYSGEIASEAAPTTWELTLTFDRSHATADSSAATVVRTLKIHLM